MAEQLTILPEFQGGKVYESLMNFRNGGHR